VVAVSVEKVANVLDVFITPDIRPVAIKMERAGAGPAADALVVRSIPDI
jgi:hypothetical protein